jgi:hypothetical protein
MDIREWVISRISDTAELFKNNFVWLFLPLFLYNFISIVIVWTFVKYYTISKLSLISEYQNFDIFMFLNDSNSVISIIISSFAFILYLLLYIIVLLWLLKSIKQSIKNEKITILENFIYGLHRFWWSMKTYWYVFVYVVLTPAIFFIVWWLFFNISYYLWSLDFLKTIWIFLMWIWFLLFIVYSIYRWLKSKFALYSAVDKDSFTKENFSNSVIFTNNNRWRIFWNFLLVWILVWFITMLISWIFWLIFFSLSWWNSVLDSIIFGLKTNNPELIKSTISEYLLNFSLFNEILSNIVKNIFNTFASIFLIIFSYLLFLRLELESNWIDLIREKNDEKEKIIEL